MLRERGAAEWERIIELQTPPHGSVEESVTLH